MVFCTNLWFGFFVFRQVVVYCHIHHQVRWLFRCRFSIIDSSTVLWLHVASLFNGWLGILLYCWNATGLWVWCSVGSREGFFCCHLGCGRYKRPASPFISCHGTWTVLFRHRWQWQFWAVQLEGSAREPGQRGNLLGRDGFLCRWKQDVS